MSCLFCSFASQEIQVPRIYESDEVFAIADINPQAPTHLLILPKVHVENAAALAAEHPKVLAELVTVAAKLANDLELTGYRLVFNTGSSAGQSVFHAHLHLLGGRAFAWPPG
ncbi:MAG: HIT domain-containing protein [Actinomycetes bacterium]|jgi:histidine triad (HIT) family protein